jgi:hypothetical protein
VIEQGKRRGITEDGEEVISQEPIYMGSETKITGGRKGEGLHFRAKAINWVESDHTQKLT